MEFSSLRFLPTINHNNGDSESFTSLDDVSSSDSILYASWEDLGRDSELPYNPADMSANATVDDEQGFKWFCHPSWTEPYQWYHPVWGFYG
jgi:hypothetical protein